MADAPGNAESFERRERFGSFEILRGTNGEQTLLGKGTFGRTYQARHVFLERNVALKIINDRFLTDAAARQRFLVEARAAAKLDHPHIAQILDFGETDGILFYAMEYCSGGDLAEFVKRNGPLSVVQTMQIGLQVASALLCAHGAGFIHRDLKPSNVMLATGDGAMITKLIDFGLVIAAPEEDAEPIDPESMPTIEQRFIGTPLFASPEQLLVQPLDARSDFFSLGMTLWFLLLGSAPDQGGSSAIIASRISAESYADRLPRKVPHQFLQVLAKLLEKKPEDRFANAAELLKALNGCAASLGIPAPHPGTAPAIGETATAEEAAETAAPPLKMVKIKATIQQSYTILAQAGESLTGANYEVCPVGGESEPCWLHVLKASLAGNPALLERLRANAAAFAANPALVRPTELRMHSDATAVVLAKPPGLDLLTELKTVGALRLTDARTLLQRLAQTCDALAEAGLPTPEMDGSRIFLEHAPAASTRQAGAMLTATPRLLPRFLTQRETSSIAPDAAQSAASTISYDMMMEERVDAPGWQFAMLIYRFVSGRNCTIAASLSPQNYAAVQVLSEEGNRILANAIARQLVHPTCVGLLADLLIAEGLMRGLATRTHTGSTGPGATAQAGSGGLTGAPDLPLADAAAASAAAWETAGHTTHFRSSLLPHQQRPAREQSNAAAAAKAKRTTRRRIVASGGALIVILAAMLAWRLPRTPQFLPSTPFPVEMVGSAEVRLHGDIPAHAQAELAGRRIALERNADGWIARIENSSALFPARLAIEAKAFKPVTVELPDRASLPLPQRVEMKRSEGTVLFTRLEGADYDHAMFRMTSQLPDEQSYIEVERYPISPSFGSDGKVNLPTGVYQVILQGVNPGIVRARRFTNVTIQPNQTVTFELPLPIAGSYSGTVILRSPAGEKSRPVELTIEPGLVSGSYQERTSPSGPKLTLSEGRLEADGTYTARIQFSEIADRDSQFDRVFTLKRTPDGGAEFESFEASDVNPTMEQRLNRGPYDKAKFSVKGTLRPTAR